MLCAWRIENLSRNQRRCILRSSNIVRSLCETASIQLGSCIWREWSVCRWLCRRVGCSSPCLLPSTCYSTLGRSPAHSMPDYQQRYLPSITPVDVVPMETLSRRTFTMTVIPRRNRLVPINSSSKVSPYHEQKFPSFHSRSHRSRYNVLKHYSSDSRASPRLSLHWERP